MSQAVDDAMTEGVRHLQTFADLASLNMQRGRPRRPVLQCLPRIFRAASYWSLGRPGRIVQ